MPNHITAHKAESSFRWALLCSAGRICIWQVVTQAQINRICQKNVKSQAASRRFYSLQVSVVFIVVSEHKDKVSVVFVKQ